MCFVTITSKIRIATKDIVCYKTGAAGRLEFYSRYRGFKYEYNRIYSRKSKFKIFLYWLLDKSIFEEGYHSYNFHESDGYDLVKCIIPKGSLYLVNDKRGEYCSSRIIILNEVLNRPKSLIIV